MDDDEVTRLIDEVDENRDGKLDYKEVSSDDVNENWRNVANFLCGTSIFTNIVT